MRIALLLCFLFFTHTLVAQWVIKKDLHENWLVSDSVAYRAYDDKGYYTTIYFTVPVKTFQGDYLMVRSAEPVSVFLNGSVLLDQIQHVNLSIDSLQKKYRTSQFFVALHSDNPVSPENLRTFVASAVQHQATSPSESYTKMATVFRDFSFTAVLIMTIFLVSVIRLNPGLSADYFSIRKLFSFRESEDDHYYYRVTSGTILFYVFTSLMTSLFLMIIIRFTGIRLGIEELVTASYGRLVFIWLTISLYVLLFLFAKIVVIYLTSVLFGIREVAGYHFFNFVRILLITVGILSLILLIYFVLHGHGWTFYNTLYASLPWILGAWIVLGFFKLASRVRHTPFHLFSYICATELIPFFVIIEVLNK